MDAQFAQLLHRWLSIPPTGAEPNHYELLGLTVLETDPQVIQFVASWRRGFLKQKLADGVTEVAPLIAAVERAERILTRPQTKSAYDLELRIRFPAWNSPSAATSAPYDGHRQWLGIVWDHPEPIPDHRLLGVAAEETDPIVIKNACDQRVEPLRTIERETGTEQRHASELLKALFQAKRRLDQRLKEAAKNVLMTTGTASLNDEARTPNSTAETATNPSSDLIEQSEFRNEVNPLRNSPTILSKLAAWRSLIVGSALQRSRVWLAAVLHRPRPQWAALPKELLLRWQQFQTRNPRGARWTLIGIALPVVSLILLVSWRMQSPDLNPPVKSDQTLGAAEPELVAEPVAVEPLKPPPLPLEDSHGRPTTGTWISLFDQKQLGDWTPIGNSAAVWNVQEGLIIGRVPKTDGRQIPGILATKQSHFKNFLLRVETTMSLESNSKGNRSAVLFRDQIQVLLGGLKTSDVTGGIVYPANISNRNRPQFYFFEKATGSSLAPAEWFTLEVFAKDAKIMVFVKDQLVAEHQRPSRPVVPGPIGISCDEECYVRVRKVEILPLPD